MSECDESVPGTSGMDHESQSKKRTREEMTESSDEGFITVTRSKLKRTPRNEFCNELNKPKGTDDLTEYHEICITSLKELPKQMSLAKLLREEKMENITRIRYKSAFRVFVQFKTQDDAERLLKCCKFQELDYRCHKTYESTVSFGIMRGVDLDMTEEELLKTLECDTTITSLKRLKRVDSAGKWIDSESIRICFENSQLPEFVYAYRCRFKIEPFVFPVSRCSGCWKFGHIIKFCPIKKILCPKCGSTEHDNCDTENLRCLNCKGSHFVLSKECPYYLKEKDVRLIMSRQNISYKKALQIYIKSREQEAEADREEHHKEDLFSNPDWKRPESYSSKLKKTVHCSMDEEIEDASNTPIKSSEKQQQPLNRKQKKQGKKVSSNYNENQFHKTDAEMEECPQNTESSEYKHFDAKRIFTRIQTKIFSTESFELKVTGIMKIIFEECKVFIMSFLTKGKFLENIVDYFSNCYGGSC